MRTLLSITGLLLLIYTAAAQQPSVTIQLLRPDYPGQARFYTSCLAPAGHGVQLHYSDSRITWPDNAYLITDASGNVLADSQKLVNRHFWSGFLLRYLPETGELVQSLGSGVEDSTNVGDIALRRWNATSFQPEPTAFGGNPNIDDYLSRVVNTDGKRGYLIGADCKDSIRFGFNNTVYPVSPSASISHVDVNGVVQFAAKFNVAKWGVGTSYIHDLLPIGANKYFATIHAHYEYHSGGTGYNGAIVAGYNSSGDTLFTKHIPGFPYGLQPSNGGAMLVSVTVEHLDSVRTAAYPRLVKLDSLGNIEWEQICRGAVAGIAIPLILSQPLPDGGILLGYTTRNPNNMYGNEMFVSRYSATGQMVWEQFITLAGADNIEQLMLHPDGTIWAAGQHIIPGTASKTMLLAKLTDPTLLSADLAQSPLVAVWPNPVGEGRTLHVQLTSAQATLELFDMQGRSLRTHTTTTPETDLDMSGLPPGVYLLRITDSNGSATQRVVVPE